MIRGMDIMTIEIIEIDNLCEDNKYFLLDSPGSHCFLGELITSKTLLSSRANLWEFLLKDNLGHQNFYILSTCSVKTAQKSQVWILKNRLWDRLFNVNMINNVYDKNFLLKEDVDFISAFFWVKIDLLTNTEIVDKLLSTDKFYLIISLDNINNKLNELIKKGWVYHSSRQMQVPKNILDFIYDNNLKVLIALGRFDDKEKDLLIIQKNHKNPLH